MNQSALISQKNHQMNKLNEIIIKFNNVINEIHSEVQQDFAIGYTNAITKIGKLWVYKEASVNKIRSMLNSVGRPLTNKLVILRIFESSFDDLKFTVAKIGHEVCVVRTDMYRRTQAKLVIDMDMDIDVPIYKVNLSRINRLIIISLFVDCSSGLTFHINTNTMKLLKRQCFTESFSEYKTHLN